MPLAHSMRTESLIIHQLTDTVRGTGLPMPELLIRIGIRFELGLADSSHGETLVRRL